MWNHLVEPPESIQEPERCRQSRLLSALLLGLILFSLAVAAAWLVITRAPIHPAGYLGIALIVLAYILNRRGHYGPAAILIITTIVVFPFLLVMTRPPDLMALEFLLISVLLTGMFLSARATMVVAIANALGILALAVLLPQIPHPEIWLTTLAAYGAGSLLVILSISHRNALEKDWRPDLAESKAAEALRQSEERYRIVSQVMSDYAYTVRVVPGPEYKTELEWITGAFEQITGYTIEEALAGINWLGQIHPDDHPIVHRRRQIILSGQPNVGEYRMKRKDGAYYWIRAYDYPQWDDAENRVVRIYSAVQNITEQKRVEDELRASEARYSGIITSAMDAIITLDSQQRVVLLNTAAEQMFGCTAADVLGQPVDRFIPQPLREKHRLLIEDFGQKGVTNRRMGALGAIKGLRSNGEVFPAESSISQIEAGGQKYYTVILRDITERVQGEAALKEAKDELEMRVQERTAELSRTVDLLNQEVAERKAAEIRLSEERNLLRALMDNIPDFIYVKDAQSRFILNNTSHRRFMGVSSLDELVGKSDFDYFSQELAEQYHADEQAVLQSGQPMLQREEASRSWDGRTIWALTTKVPLSDSNGQIVGIVGITRDITERKEALESLRKQAELLDLAHDAILVRDMDSRIVFWNRGAEAAYGRGKDEALGQLTHELFQTQFPKSREAVDTALLETGFWEGELTHIQQDGATMVVASRQALQRDEQGQPIAILEINRDITQRKQAEKRIKQLNRDLAQRASELEASNKEMEAFTYSVSHDLRAPLRAMDGFSRILLDDYAPQLPAEAQRYLQLVRDNAQQMSRLINGLLLLSRLGRQELTRQAVSPAEVVRHTLEDLRSEMEGRQIEISIGELPTVQADPVLIKQIYANLLQNALKFTRLRKVTTIEVGFQWDNGQPVYWIRDNGVGFDMRYADKLFGVFQRMHRAEDFEGTGIGLATVQRIVHRHGGRIWAEAEVDRGATFFFTLGGTDNATE